MTKSLNVEVSSAEKIMEAIVGLTIVRGAVNDDGIDISFNDGRSLVITGSFAMGIYREHKELLH